MSKIIILYYKHVNLCTNELNLIAKAVFGRDMEYDRLKIRFIIVFYIHNFVPMYAYLNNNEI